MGRDEVKRSVRVAERIRAELMELLLRGEVRDPGAQGVLVSAVRVSDDLSHAWVYIRHLSATGEAERTKAVEAMSRASGFLRRELAHRMNLRTMPSLRFDWDDSIDHGLRMEELLAEIRREEGLAEDPDGDAGGEPG